MSAWRLTSGAKRFIFAAADPANWTARLEPCEVSPSYGVRRAARRLVFNRSGALVPLVVGIAREEDAHDLADWLAAAYDGGADGDRAA